LGVAAEIFTNGTLIDDGIVQAFQRYDVKHVRVSIHGGRAETHDDITRIPGSFSRALAGVRRLKESGLAVSWQMVVCRQNFSEMRLALEQAVDFGLTGFRLGSLYLFGRGKALSEQQLSGKQEAQMWRFLDEATMVHGTQINLGWGADFCMEEPWKPYVLEPPERRMINPADTNVFLRFCKSSLCGTGVRSVGLRADGTLIPCPAMPDLALGKARGNIKYLWQTSPILESLRHLDLSGFSHCRACGMRYTCGGGCRASAYHVTGSVSGPDIKRCKGNKALLKVQRSGFFTQEEIAQGLSKMNLASDARRMEYINDVRTEGLGPWIPYWAIISSKWREGKHLGG
jgi:radical SAM protein with 4Fe4S-binding SPASM domain